MNVPRETVAKALFALLSTIQVNNSNVFNSSSRRAKPWAKVNTADQPAMFLIHSGEEAVQNQAYGLTKWLLHFEVLIYARTDPSPATAPDTLINSILDAIDATMQSKPPGERQTLGNAVYHAWIEGQILIDSGILDEQIAMLIPVRVLTGV